MRAESLYACHQSFQTIDQIVGKIKYHPIDAIINLEFNSLCAIDSSLRSHSRWALRKQTNWFINWSIASKQFVRFSCFCSACDCFLLSQISDDEIHLENTICLMQTLVILLSLGNAYFSQRHFLLEALFMRTCVCAHKRTSTPFVAETFCNAQLIQFA